MNFQNLDPIETTQGISRALTYAQKIAEALAKKKASADEVAAELKLASDRYEIWEKDASKYRQLVAWHKQLPKAEQDTNAAKLAAEAIELLGRSLYQQQMAMYY